MVSWAAWRAMVGSGGQWSVVEGRGPTAQALDVLPQLYAYRWRWPPIPTRLRLCLEPSYGVRRQRVRARLHARQPVGRLASPWKVVLCGARSRLAPPRLAWCRHDHPPRWRCRYRAPRTGGAVCPDCVRICAGLRGGNVGALGLRSSALVWLGCFGGVPCATASSSVVMGC